MKSNIKYFIFCTLLLLASFIFSKFYCTAIVNGNSMFPTLHNNDFIFVSKVKDINSGDIVITNDSITGKNLVKRVIGVQSDKIEFKDDELYVNDVKINEDYINNDGHIDYDDSSYIIDNDCYFVLGDNRNNSMDSRVFGEISKSDIIGVVICNFSNYGITKKTIEYFIKILMFLALILFIITFKIERRLK